MKKVKGLKSTNWLLQNSHKDVKYSMGNRVINIVITIYGASWVLEISRECFVKYVSNHYAVQLKRIQNDIKCKL